MATGESPGVSTKEYIVRVPKQSKKHYHVMKFNSSSNIDFTKWTQVKMVRENNSKQFKYQDDAMPKFGEGSEFGRDLKEEARRKKLGINRKLYKAENQPWLMKVGGKSGKKFRGIRGGGVSDNASFYVFTQAVDGAFEAIPVEEWYNFTPFQRYKTLGAEKAEELFSHRENILNKFAIRVQKKLRTDEDAEIQDDEEVSGNKKGEKKKGTLKISDMDDWVESGDELDSEGDDEDGEKKEKKKKDDSDDERKKNNRSKDTKKKKKKENVSDDEALEDSDDGDEEGREVDYMSDESSESEEELIQESAVIGVDQETALANLLDSDESEDEDDKSKKDKNEANEAEEENGPKKSKKEKRKAKKAGNEDNSDSSENDPGKGESHKPKEASKSVPQVEEGERLAKRIVDNIMDPSSTPQPMTKKQRLENFGASSSSSHISIPSNDIISEEAVKRYLARKPMTTTELLRKFKPKKTGLTSQELVSCLGNILKKINPKKQKVQGVCYWSIKE